jgi:hypothetical protein
MRPFTQTDFTPGNCVQTAVACVLDLDPRDVLDQTRFKDVVPREDGRGWRYGTPRYLPALEEWLRAERGLRLEMKPARRLRLVKGGWHIMTGRTVRTRHNGGLRHAVVARDNVPVWDPHPSRDLLLLDGELSSLFLVPVTGDLSGAPVAEVVEELSAALLGKHGIVGVADEFGGVACVLVNGDVEHVRRLLPERFRGVLVRVRRSGAILSYSHPSRVEVLRNLGRVGA